MLVASEILHASNILPDLNILPAPTSCSILPDLNILPAPTSCRELLNIHQPPALSWSRSWKRKNGRIRGARTIGHIGVTSVRWSG
jgi:hypothetical protein